MKKLIILSIFIISTIVILLNSINKQKLIKILENTNTYDINVIYPKTNVKKLDKELDNFIYKQISIFKNNITNTKYLRHNELNINYEYYKVNNRYINISLKLYIYHSSENISEYYVQTFTYDIKNNCFYNIVDIFNINLLDKINNYFLKNNISIIDNLGEINYLFNDKDLIIYYISDKLYTYNIPLIELNKI